MHNILTMKDEEFLPLVKQGDNQHSSYSTIKINQSDVRTDTPNTDNVNHNNNRTQYRRNPVEQGGFYVCLLYVAVITDWPWEIATYILVSSEKIEQKKLLYCL